MNSIPGVNSLSFDRERERDHYLSLTVEASEF